MQDGIAARRAALHMLNAVLGEGRMLAEARGADLAPAERARAGRLAREVLRRVEPADRALAPFLRRRPPLAVMNALRLGVVEMALGHAAHGVVNAAVTLARESRGGARMAGMVNAVLRRVPAEALATGAPQRLPDWLRTPLVRAHGEATVEAIEAVHATTPPLDLTRKPGAVVAPKGRELPTGSLRLDSWGRIADLDGFSAGGWWVQDAATALAVRLLDPQPGERILDLCAAPGGKTLQLAAAGAEVTALDMSARRMERLRENLARTGLRARTIVADALDWAPEEPHDAILIDVPCSATGTIRRHPDLPFVKDGAEVPALVALQERLFARAVGWLRPGGRIVYAACSLLPIEGEEQVRRMLAQNPHLVPDPHVIPGTDDAWCDAHGGLRLRPDYWAEIGGMDGFFCARLRHAG